MILDTVFMIANKKLPSLVYGRPARSAADAWAYVIEDEIMGTGVTKARLIAQGYRATKVQVVVPE